MISSSRTLARRPRLSVVIPVLNEERIIDACLTALESQAEPPEQIIVVDNGSTDATPEIVRRHPDVTLLFEPVRGIGGARTRGFDGATGDVLARIDADTVVSPGWSVAARDAFARDPGLAAAGGPAVAQRLPVPLAKALYSAFRVFHRTLFRVPMIMYGHNMALRADVWQMIRPILSADDSISEDVDVTLAVLSTGGRIALLRDMRVEADVLRTLAPAKLARYWHADSETRRKYRELARAQ
ncbi:glycosyltransferase family 2 protein [Gryllotalpicola kribbensis]